MPAGGCLMRRSNNQVTRRQVQLVGIAVLLSILGAVFHNGREFGLAGLLALETATIPIVLIEITLFILWWKVPSLRNVAMAALGLLALLHLVGGALISVLPLGALPFEPEQSFDHYFSHIIYGLGQLPLLWFSFKWFFVSQAQESTSSDLAQERD
jgi:hypothetical protein